MLCSSHIKSYEILQTNSDTIRFLKQRLLIFCLKTNINWGCLHNQIWMKGMLDMISPKKNMNSPAKDSVAKSI